MYDYMLIQLNPRYRRAAFWSGVNIHIQYTNLDDYTDLDNTILGLYAIL